MAEANFLDDKLYNCIVNTEIKSPVDFQSTVNVLYGICEHHFKKNLRVGMTKKEAKTILDRTFKSWDLFISRLKKEKWFLIDVLSKYSYKDTFMENTELKELYNSM